MMRTRLLWFAAGFAITGAAISHFVWRDLLIDRTSLVSEMKQKFDDLEARVLKIEGVSHGNSD
uniref:Uncharacterized protein n=1 Tax=Kalanchoe fedtschenkoi TaxID=63787 RepID=A0A7N0VLT7_KALFE